MKFRLPLHHLALHPFLFALFPVFFLYSQNLGQVPASDLVTPLCVTLGATAILLLAAWVVLRDVCRAALVTSVGLFAIFAYGPVFDKVDGSQVQNLASGRQDVLLPVWGALAVILMLAAWRSGRRLHDITKALNIVSVAVVATVLLPLAGPGLSSTFGARPAAAKPRAVSELHPNDRMGRPDIYYIILDRYAGADALQERFGYDNSAFLRALKERGFYVPNSWANYPRTTHSLASSLNMRYLDNSTNCEWDTLFKQLNGNSVVKSLQAIGYDYVNIGSWWSHTARDPSAEVNLTAPVPTEFSRVLYETTMLSPLGQKRSPSLDVRRQRWRVTRFQFDRLAASKAMRGPKFVFAHILLPHEPFVFDRDGKFLSVDEASQRGGSEMYLGQLEYANKRVLRLLDTLLATPRRSRPVVILQADEGAFPLGYSGTGYRWDHAAPNELMIKMNILNAYYWPNLDRTGLYEGVTPVNSFRLLFKRYFGAHVRLLPDRIKVWEDGLHPCRFHDVTGKVSALRKPPLEEQR